MFFEETNPYCFAKLVLTPLCQELTQKEKKYGDELSLQEMKENFRRQAVNISRQDISYASRNIFQACLQSRGQHIETVLLKHVSWNAAEILTLYSRRMKASYAKKLSQQLPC
jgi:hypothetical protein